MAVMLLGGKKKKEEPNLAGENTDAAVEAAEKKKEEPRATVDVAAFKKELKDLQNTRKKLDRAIAKVRDRACRSDAAAEELKARDEAEKAVREKESNDPGVAVAGKASSAAYKELCDLIELRLKDNKEYIAAAQALQAINARKGDIEWQRRLAEFTLRDHSSPIARVLDAGQELVMLRNAAVSTERNSEEWKAYHAARKAKLDRMPQAVKLNEQIANAKEQMVEVGKEWSAARRKVNDLKRAVEQGKDDEEVVASKKRRSEASKALKGAISAATVEEEAACNEARKVQDAKVKELMAADKEGQALLEKKGDIKVKIAVLEKKIREAGKNPE